MSVDNDINSFNDGLGELFSIKRVKPEPDKVIRYEEQKVPWKKRRTRRTQSDTFSMVGHYSHHEGDKQWLVAQLKTIPIQKREAAMMQYAQLYTDTAKGEQNQNKKEGEARRISNSWMVDLIEKMNRH